MINHINLIAILFLGALVLALPAAQSFAQDSDDQAFIDQSLDEASQFLNYCAGDRKMANYYDCECLSAKFLDQRLDFGPDINRASIMQAISGECVNAALAAGEEYQECLGNFNNLPKNKDPEIYCECVANTYANLFETNKAKPSSKNFIKFRTQAHVSCRNPALSRKVYGLN